MLAAGFWRGRTHRSIFSASVAEFSVPMVHSAWVAFSPIIGPLSTPNPNQERGSSAYTPPTPILLGLVRGLLIQLCPLQWLTWWSAAQGLCLPGGCCPLGPHPPPAIRHLSQSAKCARACLPLAGWFSAEDGLRTRPSQVATKGRRRRPPSQDFASGSASGSHHLLIQAAARTQRSAHASFYSL
jgi:hypothetical protein